MAKVTLISWGEKKQNTEADFPMDEVNIFIHVSHVLTPSCSTYISRAYIFTVLKYSFSTLSLPSPRILELSAFLYSICALHFYSPLLGFPFNIGLALFLIQ